MTAPPSPDRVDRRASLDGVRELEEEWDLLARDHGLWAVCTDPKIDQWDPSRFLATGEIEIRRVFAHLEALPIMVEPRGAALDFGCGAGRLTQALASRFAVAHGVDISREMLSLATELAAGSGVDCRFHHNSEDSLDCFQNESLAFIYSSIVLQHMPPDLMRRYLREFGRILAPGGVVVCQVPDSWIPGSRIDRFKAGAAAALRLARSRARLRTRLRAVVAGGTTSAASRQVRAPAEMGMHALAESAVRSVLTSAGLEVVDVAFTNSTASHFNGNLVLRSDPPTSGWASKQYVAVRARLGSEADGLRSRPS